MERNADIVRGSTLPPIGVCFAGGSGRQAVIHGWCAGIDEVICGRQGRKDVREWLISRLLRCIRERVSPETYIHWSSVFLHLKAIWTNGSAALRAVLIRSCSRERGCYTWSCGEGSDDGSCAGEHDGVRKSRGHVQLCRRKAMRYNIRLAGATSGHSGNGTTLQDVMLRARGSVASSRVRWGPLRPGGKSCLRRGRAHAVMEPFVLQRFSTWGRTIRGRWHSLGGNYTNVLTQSGAKLIPSGPMESTYV